MPHTFAFNPPVRGRGGPLLHLRTKEPLLDLEKSLEARRLAGPESPYRKSREVENLLDDITFGIRSPSMDPALMVSLGLNAGRGTSFELSRGHIHNTDAAMRPDILLGHSSAEGPPHTVKVAVVDELSVLAVTLLRELGKTSYLSTIRTDAGSTVSGIAILSDGKMDSFIIYGNHPPVSELTVFEDKEALDVLRLLRAHNGLRKLFDEVKDSSVLSGSDEARYRFLIGEFAKGALSAHHLVRVVEEIFVAFTERFPALIGDKGSLS